MKDDKGLYYHPDPSDFKSRVYVRQGIEGPEFRLCRADYPDVWERHGWLGEDVLRAAAAMYAAGGKGANPMQLYDFAVAKALIKENS